MARGSSTVHTLELRVFQTGIPQVASSLQTLNTTTQASTTQMGALGTATRNTVPAMAAASGGANQYSGALGNVNSGMTPVRGGLSQTNLLVGQNAVAYQTASGRAGDYSTSTNRVTSSVLPLVGRVTGLSFAFTGLFTSMGEAQGMQELLALSQDKVNELTALQNELIQAGATDSALYTRVTNELERAQGALVRQQTITNLSMQDSTFFIASIAGQLMPLMIKGMVELRAKAVELGGGFTGLATIIGGKFQSGLITFTEKIGLLPPMFTSAGKSANTFGGALRALALNPFTIAMTAAAALLGIFITNAFGARDAINAFGVWLGNTIPFLKPFLVLLGQAGDALVTAFGGSIRQVTSDAKAAIPEVEDFEEAIRGVYEVSANNSAIDELKTDIDNLNQAVKDAQIPSKGWSNVMAELAVLTSKVSNPSKEYSAILSELTTKLQELYDKGQAPTIEQMKEIEALTAKLNGQFKKDISTKQEQIQVQKQLAAGLADYSGNVKIVASALELTGPAQDEFVKGLDDTQKSMFDVANGTDLTGDALLRYLANVEKSIGAMTVFEERLVRQKDGNVDLIATIENLEAAEESHLAGATAVWNGLVDLVDMGVISYDGAVLAIKRVAETHDVAGEAYNDYAQKVIDGQIQVSDKERALIDILIEKGIITVETENDIQEAIDKTQKKIDEEIAKYNLQEKAIGLSVKQQEALIKISQEEEKEINAVTSKLQELAIARGANAKIVAGGNAVLRTFINTHHQDAATTQEVYDAYTILAGAREDEQVETQKQEAAYRLLLKTMGSQIDTTNLNLQTMKSLVSTYDDINNATKIATGEVAKWNLELERTSKIETETIVQLDKLANAYGIEIPQSIKNKGIPAIKEFIEAELGVGEGAKKARDEALKAFDEIAGKAKSALDTIISDALGEDSDNIKKAIKGIRKAGFELDSLTAVKRVIQILLDDESFENDLIGLGDIMKDNFGKLEGFTHDEGILLGQLFSEAVRDQIGKKMPEAADAVDQIWEQVLKSSKPTDTGDVIIGNFGKALQNNEYLNSVGIGVGSTIAEGIEGAKQYTFDAGGHLVESTAEGAENSTALEQASQHALNKYLVPLVQNAELKEAGEGMTEEVAEGAVDGSGRHLPAASNKILNDLMTGFGQSPIPKQTGEQLGADTSTGVETGVQPIPGIFNDAFVQASVQSGTTLALIVTLVQQTMSNMSTSVATYSNSMQVNFTTSLTAMGDALPPVGDKILVFQQQMSDLSTSIATYASSMTTNIQTFGTNAGSSLDTLSDTIKTGIWKTFSDFSTSVATYTDSMTKNTDNFGKTSTKTYDGLADTVKKGIWDTLSNFSKSVATYTDSMSKNIDKWSKSAIKSFDAFIKKVGEAIKEVEAFIKKLNSIPEKKTVTIEQKFTSSGQKYYAEGGSFLVTSTTHIGDKVVGEEGPEIVTVTPLKGTGNDKVSIDLSRQQGTLPTSGVVGRVGQGGSGGGLSGGGTAGSPIINVSGNIYATLKSQSGQIIAKEVIPFLMKDMHTIT